MGRWLSDHGRWVSPDEAYNRLAHNQVSEPLFVLTFDDGFASVHHQAAPLLDELGIKPLLFIKNQHRLKVVHYRVLAAISRLRTADALPAKSRLSTAAAPA
jgi:hypothetical protein